MAINGTSFFRTAEVENLTQGEARELDRMVGELLGMSDEFRQLVSKAKAAVIQSHYENQSAPHGVRFNESRRKFFVNGQK